MHSDSDEWRVYKRGSMSDAVDDGSSVLRYWWWLAFFKARETQPAKKIRARKIASRLHR